MIATGDGRAEMNSSNLFNTIQLITGVALLIGLVLVFTSCGKPRTQPPSSRAKVTRGHE